MLHLGSARESAAGLAVGLERSALGAVTGLGAGVATAANLDAVQGAKILAVCVISAGFHAAMNAVIDLFHGMIPPFVWYKSIITSRRRFIPTGSKTRHLLSTDCL